MVTGLYELTKGTKVKCISNIVNGNNTTIVLPYLTIDKTYIVIEDFGTSIALITDNGIGMAILKTFFITLDEHREKQLEKLLN